MINHEKLTDEIETASVLQDNKETLAIVAIKPGTEFEFPEAEHHSRIEIQSGEAEIWIAGRHCAYGVSWHDSNKIQDIKRGEKVLIRTRTIFVYLQRSRSK